MTEPSKAMTTEEASKRKQKGVGPDYITVGGSIRYTKESLDEFVRAK